MNLVDYINIIDVPSLINELSNKNKYICEFRPCMLHLDLLAVMLKRYNVFLVLRSSKGNLCGPSVRLLKEFISNRVYVGKLISQIHVYCPLENKKYQAFKPTQSKDTSIYVSILLHLQFTVQIKEKIEKVKIY